MVKNRIHIESHCIEIDGLEAQDVVDLIQDFLLRHLNSDLYINLGDCCASFEEYRMETDEELKSRELRVKAWKEREKRGGFEREALEREQYEKLKLKFEGK
tara:strand:+ start:46 stop:348 length:303 start_codon:yes stop_codon:yes gene_type:complete